MDRSRRTRLAAGLVLLAGLAAVAGCSSFNVSQDYDQGFDFSTLRTFGMMPITPESGINDLDAKRVADALVAELARKGIQPSDDPDFGVALHFGRQQQLQVDSYGYGYGRGRYYGGGTVDVTQYTEGTLVIDFVDLASNSLVWRGVGKGILDGNPSPEKKTANIQQAVARIIDQYPPR